MTDSKNQSRPLGRRERKRRETRANIANAALALFLKKGFYKVTVDEIAEVADVSKRTFFDYFPAKEDVVQAWQDRFIDPLCAAVEAASEGLSPAQAAQSALIDTLMQTADEASFEVTALIRDTPALRARDQRKYVFLEERLAQSLQIRYPSEDPLAMRLLAMIVIGAVRVGSDLWHETEGLDVDDMRSFTTRVLDSLWRQLSSIKPA